MLTSFGSRAFLVACLTFSLGCYTKSISGQIEESLGDNAVDPVRVFERAQNAHAHGEIDKALRLYEEALKLRPEFPEAEFQRATALVSLARFKEAESGFRRAIDLRKDWSLPYSGLGALLVRLNRDREADPILRLALKLDPRDNVALRLLADIRLRAGDAKEALELARRATADKDAPVSAWLLRALVERANSDTPAALASLDHILQNEPENVAALVERSEIRANAANYPGAIEDLRTALRLQPKDKQILSRLADTYQRAGQPEEARRIAETGGLIKPPEASKEGEIQVIGTPQEIAAANDSDPVLARRSLEKLLEKNPRNPMLLARLGASYRTDDPSRSLEYYRLAAEIQPHNVDYAVGYGSALVQARRFAEATVILRRATAAAPDNYTAHANLATALYELKQYPDALAEYEWLLKSKPDLAVAYFFIATVHDYLGEYDQALASYETFLARADAKTNQLEIEKVKLRLPSLRRQIQLKQGVKHKS